MSTIAVHTGPCQRKNGRNVHERIEQEANSLNSAQSYRNHLLPQHDIIGLELQRVLHALHAAVHRVAAILEHATLCFEE